MGDFSQSPAFGIPAALSTAAGAALLGRGGTLGTPLGIALTGLGGYGLDYASNKAQQKQQQKLADVLRQVNPSVGPAEPRNTALANLIGAGMSPADATAVLKTPEAKNTIFAKPGEPVGLINETTNTFTPTKGLGTLPAAQKQPSEFDQFRNAPENRGLTETQAYTKYKAAGRAPERPRYATFPNPDGTVTRVNIDTMAKDVIPGISKTAPKPAPDVASVIESSRNKALADWKADVAYKGASSGTISKLFKGMDITDPNVYANVSAATTLENKKLLPPDVATLDPKAKLLRKGGKVQIGPNGRPVYQLSNGKTVESDAF